MKANMRINNLISAGVCAVCCIACQEAKPEITWSLMHPTQLDSVYMQRIIEESASHPVDNFEICGGCNSGCDGSLDGLLFFEEYPLGAAAQDSAIVAANIANMKAILRMSHAAGKEVYYWHREVLCNDGMVKSIPELIDNNGEFNLLGKAYEDFLRYKIRKTFETVPDLDGIVLTLTEASFSSLHNSCPDIYPPEKVVEKIGGLFAEELEARGKRFILRSFGSIDEDYNNIAKGASLLAKKYRFEVETKITPFDFNPFLPDNKFLVKTPGCTLGAECDVLGEFLGGGRMLPEQIDEIVRYVNYAETKDVDRYTIRLDRFGKSIFDVYPINLFAYEQAILNPGKTAEQIRSEYYNKFYPTDVADVLIQMSKDGMKCVKKAQYIDGHLFFHSLSSPTMLYIKASGILGVFAKEGNLARARKQWGILNDKNVPGREAILKEKAEALALAKKNLEVLESIADKLNPKDLSRLSEGWKKSYDETVGLYHLCNLICAYFDCMEANDPEGKALSVAHKELTAALVGLDPIHPVQSYADRFKEEYPIEFAMRQKFAKCNKVIDYILPGSVTDQQRIEHYMLGSFCEIKDGQALAIVGNHVFPDCYLAMSLNGSDSPAYICVKGIGTCNIDINGETSLLDLNECTKIKVPAAASYEVRFTKAKGQAYPKLASVALIKQ